MTTATLQDTTVLLDNLYTGYNEVLRQAQKQLEDIDLTQDQIKTIAETVTGKTGFKNDVAIRVANNLRDAISTEGHDIDISALVTMLYTRLKRELESGLAKLVDELAQESIKQYMASPEFTEKIEAKIKEYEGVADAIALDLSFTEMVKSRMDLINAQQITE